MSIQQGESQERLQEAHRRLDRHEGRIQRLETDNAVSEERYRNIEKILEKIQSTNIWVVRLIIGSIITGVIAFIMAGGLNNG